MRKFFLLGLVSLLGCGPKKEVLKNTLFQSLPPSNTHIDFINKVSDTKEFNIFNYRNFYNGGGVAIGDVNNDGLSDVFVTSNFDDNKLYLNKGNFVFEDITEKAGVAGKKSWSTGATFADVNGDGFLDIYVCNSGNRKKDDRANELFINNGDLTFTEKAEMYGLDDKGFSTHAAFFDFDRDGDLDMYLLNNSFTPVSRLNYVNIRDERDKLGGHKFFRNELISKDLAKNGKELFTDISEEAGIYGSLIGFGLGITVGDINNDNWLDIYISNDFYERDYLYLNNKNGTFSEVIKDEMGHISLSSMGADIADINNDGNLDIFVTDMLPWNDKHLKSVTTYEGYDLAQFKLSRDYHHQYMQNMMHINNGDGTFSELARFSKVHATDWSWGALIFDMDNDGNKDIFVANGIAKDLTDQDFVNFLGSEATMRQALENGKANNIELINKIASNPIPNYAFKNLGGLRFKNQADDWGLATPGFSNGSAYGDLDNDGDLDLVVNNVNSNLSVYKNTSVETLKTKFLKVSFKGTNKNLNGIGAKVKLYQSDKMQYLQQMPNRGFQSSVDLKLVFGLGQNEKIDSVLILWPDDKYQTLKNVKANTTLLADHKNAGGIFNSEKKAGAKIFADVGEKLGINYKHAESNFIDYKRDPLLKQMYSTQGPALATGDVNGDGLDDVYLGGAAGQLKKIFLQNKDGKFKEGDFASFLIDSSSEDVDAVFFDADNDKDLDLFVVTGSNEFMSGANELADRLYFNDGKGNFTKSNSFPDLKESGSCVAAADFDNDGDTDLFVGSRMVPGKYGYDPMSFLFVNDGSGKFKNYTKRLLQKNELGMITGATWQDLNNDKYPELILVGDWMPIKIFVNKNGHGFDKEIELPQSSGWWNAITPADIDNDGDMDFIVGNLGENSRLTASEKSPAELYAGDFDKNGTNEQIITCAAEDGKNYPMVLKHDLQLQMPEIKKKFLKYEDYAGKQMHEIFTEEQLKSVITRQVVEPRTCMMINKGNLNFTLKPLPAKAQWSQVMAIKSIDYNFDGVKDLLLTGNFFDVLPEMGRYDGNYGLLLKGLGKGEFETMPAKETGFFVKGQVRKMGVIKTVKDKSLILLAKNDDYLQVLNFSNTKK